MSYIKAQDILPKELISEIQKHIDGQCIYIPKKEENKKICGQSSKAKEYFMKRNKEIYEKYISGTKVKELALEYFLVDKSIQRIIRQIRNMEL